MERWRFKSILKIILIYNAILGVGTFLLILHLLEETTFAEFILSFLGAMFVIGVIPSAILIITYLITNYSKNKVKYDGYYTEIEKMYPPAMLSYLLDDFIEKNEDLLATILNLSIKKNINIEENSNGLLISVNENSKEIQNLYSHEKYIIDALNQKQKINFGKFYEKVIYDCENERLIYKKKNSLVKHLITIRKLLAILSLFGLLFCVSNPYIFRGSVILAIIAYGAKFIIKTHNKTSKGLEFAIKSKMLKNYIRDYTLLDEKDYDYIKLVDKYIPYALALGEANKIENLHVEGNRLIKDIVENTNIIDELVNRY